MIHEDTICYTYAIIILLLQNKSSCSCESKTTSRELNNMYIPSYCIASDPMSEAEFEDLSEEPQSGTGKKIGDSLISKHS